MYYLLYSFFLNWQYDRINSLDDVTLDELIRDMHTYSPRDVCLHFTVAEAMKFGDLLTSIADVFFNGDLKGALEDFQNYLTCNNLDLIVRLEEIRGLPLADRQAAMDQLIKNLQEACKMYLALHLSRYNAGKTGPLP